MVFLVKILTKYHVQQETNEPVSTVVQRELSISLPCLGQNNQTEIIEIGTQILPDSKITC